MAHQDDSTPNTSHPEAEFYLDQLNYADPANDQFAAVERFKTTIIPVLTEIETQRAAVLEPQWREIDLMWIGKNSEESRYYSGVNDAYVRQAFKAIETQVEHIMGELFQRPGPLFAVRGSPFVDMSTIQSISASTEANIEQAKLEEEFEPFVREACKKGLAVTKVVWHEVSKANYSRKMVDEIDPETQQPTGRKNPELVGRRVFTYRGPTFHNTDIYRWYFHPITALRIEDYEIVHEYFDRSISQLRGAAKSGRLFAGEVEAVANETPSDTSRYTKMNVDARIAPWGLNTKQVARPNIFEVCEIYAKFDLYGDGTEIDCKATYCNGHVLELRQNPHPDQLPPYIVWSPYSVMDHFYKMGMGEMLRVHQSILNAIINQALDANLFQTNQMLAIDATRYQGRLSDIEVSPFSIFPFTGGPGFDVKDAMAWMAPPNTIGPALQLASMEAGHMQDVIGSQPVLQGKNTNKEMTAQENKTLVAGAQLGVSARAQSLANRVLKRWLEKQFKLEQAYRQPDEEVLITGQMPIKLPWDFFVSQVLFKWLVGSEAEAYLMAVGAQMAQQQAAESEMGDRGSQTNEDAAAQGATGNPEGNNMQGGDFGSKGPDQYGGVE